MEPGLIWAIGLGLGAIAATIFTPMAMLKASQPRRQLKVEYRSRNLFPSLPAKTGKLNVTHDGRILKDPHHVIVMITPSGRDDISSDNFDNGRSIVLTFKRAIVPGSIVQADYNGSHVYSIGQDGTSLELPPNLFQSDSKGCAASFIVEANRSSPLKAHLSTRDWLTRPK